VAIAGVGSPLVFQFLGIDTKKGLVADFASWPLVIILFLIVWLMIAVVLNWARAVDVFLTYSFRTRAFWKAGVGCTTLAVLSLPAAAALGGMVSSTGMIALLPMLLPAGLLIRYVRRGVRNIRFDRRYDEGGFRIVISLGIIGVFTTVAWM
jgi:hypothetical protein